MTVSRNRRRCRQELFSAVVLVAAVLLVAVSGAAQQPDRDVRGPDITISKLTTYVTEPLRADGSVDFAAAINQRFSKAVTPENNAAVLLIQALGPEPDGLELPTELFQQLDMRAPPAAGSYLQPQPKTPQPPQSKEQSDDERLAELNAAQNAAMSRPWSRAEFPVIADWLDQNQEPLRLVQQAVQRDQYYFPLVTSFPGEDQTVPLIGAMLPTLPSYRAITRLLCSQAMLHLSEGDVDAAWQDLLTSHRLARLIGQGGPTVIDALVAYGMESMTLDAAAVLLSHSAPDAEQARRYRDTLTRLPAIVPVSQKINLAERCVYLDSLLVIARQDKEALAFLAIEDSLLQVNRIVEQLGPVRLNWDQALQTGNAWYDRLVEICRLPQYAQRQQGFLQVRQELETLYHQLQDPEAWLAENKAAAGDSDATGQAIGKAIGDAAAAVLLPAIGRARNAEDRVRQRFQMLQTALAIAEFSAQQKHYPQSLDELVPDYLSQRPTDLFSADGPIYQRQSDGYVLYSLGENQQDDGGQTYGEEPAGDDLRIRVTSPTP